MPVRVMTVNIEKKRKWLQYVKAALLLVLVYWLVNFKFDQGLSLVESFQVKNSLCMPDEDEEAEYSLRWKSVARNLEAASRDDKKIVLVTYYYFEKPNDAQTYIETLQFFYDHAVFESDSVDFVIISQGKDPQELERVTKCEYKNVVTTRKVSVCGWYENFEHATEVAPRRKEEYTHFIFINASVRGPYVSSHTTALLKPEYKWTDLLTNIITDRVKLGGITLSCEMNLHVQSMVWVTDRVGLRLFTDSGMMSCKTCQRCPPVVGLAPHWTHWCRKNKKNHLVCNCELGLSRELLKNTDYGIGALSSVQPKNIFRDGAEEFCSRVGGDSFDSSISKNPWMKGGVYDMFPVAFDTLFWKASHDIQKDILRMTDSVVYKAKGCQPGNCCGIAS